MIQYEYPFNERIRTYLRLEHLAQRLDELCARDQALDHHFALQTLFEIVEISNRPDLKTAILADLERQKGFVQSFRGKPGVSDRHLNATVEQLSKAYSSLAHQHGKPGHELNRNDWLTSIRNRLSIPGGTCQFDLPSYFCWQQREGRARSQDLQQWSTSVRPMQTAIEALMQIVRNSGMTRMVAASAGQLQLKLPRDHPVQLLCIELDSSLNLIPEVSGNQLAASIRLLRLAKDSTLQPANVDASLKLTLCS